MGMRVCVVGAGASGLVAIKELLEEGHRVRCFEQSSHQGGVFNAPPEGRAYDSLKLTVSNYFWVFSSSPPDLEEPRRYWTKDEYSAYLLRYADHFGLHEHIELEVAVTKIKRTAEGTFLVTCSRKNG